MIGFKQLIKPDDKGLDVLAVKYAYKRLRLPGYKQLTLNKVAGKRFVIMTKAIQHNNSLKADGIYGSKTHAVVAPHFGPYSKLLYKRASLRTTHAQQVPPLPRRWPLNVFWIDNGGTSAEWGIQPSLVPQVEAICKEFNLRVTDGYGGHPPHATFSDHRVGLAVDLAGSYDAMVKCNLWADGLEGHTFRWVGGPAHDADGVEPGHYNHVHLSWYRTKPTTIFGTSKFK